MKKASPAVSTTAAPATKPAAAIPTAPLIRILKSGTCPNLSESAKLGYHIGCNADSRIQLSVHSNSGKGFFSREWVSLDAIFKAIDKCPKDKPLNGFWLGPLYAGKSINTPSFLMAVLLAEGLVKKVDRNYEKVSHDGFVSEVNKLIESGVDIKVEDKPKNGEAKSKASPAIDKSSPTDSGAASTQPESPNEVVPIKKPTRRSSTKAPSKP
jgi:hypothetical protein